MQDAFRRTVSAQRGGLYLEVLALPEIEIERAALPLQAGLRTASLSALTPCTN
jgi:hypothetical protein